MRKVKLVEYGSLTCPHCREFDEQGVPTLVEKYVKSVRSAGNSATMCCDPFDLAATLVARCNGAKGFFPMMRRALRDSGRMGRQDSGDAAAQLEQLRTCRRRRRFAQAAKFAGFNAMGSGARRSGSEERAVPQQ